MTLTQKNIYTNITIIFTLIISFVTYIIFFKQHSISPTISPDQKSIILDNKTLLTIDNKTIFNWFVNKSTLCNETDTIKSPKKQMFCKDKKYFKDQSKFTSLVTSPDQIHIAFTIVNNILSPDKIIGIFSRSTNEIKLLTNYYLGNKFIKFSPDSKYFIYQHDCGENTYIFSVIIYLFHLKTTFRLW